MNLNDVKITTSSFTSDGANRGGRTLMLNAFLEGRICATCNNGWMSSLEQRVIPRMKYLLDGRKLPSDFNYSARLELGVWAAKTAYMIDMASHGQPFVPREHLHALYRDQRRLPKNVEVLFHLRPQVMDLMTAKSRNWPTMSQFGESDLSVFSERVKSSYKVSFQLGLLSILVAYWPVQSWKPAALSNDHQWVFSNGSECYWLNHEWHIEGLSAEDIHWVFHNSYAAAPVGWKDVSMLDVTGSMISMKESASNSPQSENS